MLAIQVQVGYAPDLNVFKDVMECFCMYNFKIPNNWCQNWDLYNWLTSKRVNILMQRSQHFDAKLWNLNNYSQNWDLNNYCQNCDLSKWCQNWDFNIWF